MSVILEIEPAAGGGPLVRRAAVAVTVGELDPTGRAGVLADARAIGARGARAAAVPTFVGGVPLTADAVRQMWEQVVAELPVDAVKLGRLGGEAALRAAAEWLGAAAHPRVVADPCFLDAHGEPRISDAVGRTWRSHVLPHALVAVVNGVEAERLFGRTCEDRRGMLEAAKRLFDDGPTWVLVLGGRLAGHPVDLLYDGTGTIEFGADRVPGLRLPHTGGTLTALLTAELARGQGIPAAMEAARAALHPALAHAAPLAQYGAAVEPLAAFYDALGVDAAPVKVVVPEPSASSDKSSATP